MKSLFIAGTLLAASAAQAQVIKIGDVEKLGDVYTISNGVGSVSDSSLENQLNLASGSLDAISTGNATEGSAITDSLYLNAGDIFSFDWLWSSNEESGASFNDFSFINLNWNGLEILADTFTQDGTASTFSFTAGNAGQLQYGIGVLDVNDSQFDSFLTISNITTGSAQVAEPTSLALLGLGLLGFGVTRKKRV